MTKFLGQNMPIFNRAFLIRIYGNKGRCSSSCKHLLLLNPERHICPLYALRLPLCLQGRCSTKVFESS